MAKTNERNLNVTIKNQEDNKDELIISFSSMLSKMKKFLALWLAAAVIAGVLVFVFNAALTFSNKTPAKALISFSYSGIEKGRDPSGRKFDINSVKNPLVIEKALTSLGLDLDKVESIRSNISFETQIPQDTYDKLVTYNSVMEKAVNGNLTAAQAMLDITYYPTQFTVYFDYGAADFDRVSGVEFLNTLLECYRDYFYEQFGYNEPLGAAVVAVDYENYDYAQQLDLFRNSLRAIRSYLNSLSNDDKTSFRSSVTGYSFNDLLEYAKTVNSIDIDRISSYISVNNVTKDKDAALAYYDYRIENLNRDKDEYAERLSSIGASIEQYEKDTILIFGNGTEGTNTESSTHSEQYDQLFRQKTSVEANLAEVKQDIKYYESRRDALKNDKNSSKANVDKVKEDIASLNEKVTNIVDLTKKTADDYYENVQFAHAYNILVPASRSIPGSIGEAVSNSIKSIILIEALLFVVYLAMAVISALKSDNSKKTVMAGADDDDDDSEDVDLEELADIIEEEAEKAEKNAPKKTRKK